MYHFVFFGSVWQNYVHPAFLILQKILPIDAEFNKCRPWMVGAVNDETYAAAFVAEIVVQIPAHN